jgi:hypothetical protein
LLKFRITELCVCKYGLSEILVKIFLFISNKLASMQPNYPDISKLSALSRWPPGWAALPDCQAVEEIHEDHHDEEDKAQEEGVGQGR